MTLRTISLVAAAAILGVGLLLGSASAKPKCRRLCRDDIHACRATVPANSTCEGTRAEKRECRRGHRLARNYCRLASIVACRNDVNPDPAVCSPSGAFLDPSPGF